jgi:CheY-like chemotaxis protein
VKTSKLPVPAKVLLVDDEWRQLESRACILSMAGFPVVTARGPVEALSLATRFEELDVAVVDYEMPIMNGAALAERLKSKLPKLNVVLYSAAIAIPSHDLQRVDRLISKGEGLTELLRYLWSLSTGCCTEAAPLHDLREPSAWVTRN